MKSKNLLLSTAMVFLATTPAYAAKQMSMEEMQAQLERLAQQVDKLSGVVENQNNIIEAQKTQLQTQDQKLAQQVEKIASIRPAAGESDPNEVKIKMDKGLKIESADGKYSFQPFGRVHVDATNFIDDKSDQPNGANFRRARLGFKGDIGEDLNYKAEVDFGGESVNLKEMYLAYTGFEPADLWIGNFKPPVGLEQNTSSNYMEFIEQAPVTNAFTRDEILGIAAKGGGENWSLAAGVFNEDASVNSADDESVSFDAKGTIDLLQNSPNVLHLGLGGSYRSPNATSESVSLSAKPAGTGRNLISTGGIDDVDSVTVLGAEAAAVFGPFSAQGEYMRYSAEQSSGADPEFDGWYAQASYFLTGETRPYKGNTGNFDRVKPKSPFSLKNGGWGAWEVLARIDNLDLNDSSSGIEGGEMTDITLGLNWYLRDNARLMFNYVDVDTDGEAVVADDDPKVMTVRAQWDF